MIALIWIVSILAYIAIGSIIGGWTTSYWTKNHDAFDASMTGFICGIGWPTLPVVLPILWVVFRMIALGSSLASGKSKELNR